MCRHDDSPATTAPRLLHHAPRPDHRPGRRSHVRRCRAAQRRRVEPDELVAVRVGPVLSVERCDLHRQLLQYDRFGRRVGDGCRCLGVEPHLESGARVLERRWGWIVDVLRSGGPGGQHQPGGALGADLDDDDLLATDPATAFTVLFRDIFTDLRAYALRTVGVDAAEDLVADTLTTVWVRWAVAPKDRKEQRAWVFGVAHNKVREQQRAARRRGRLAARVISLRPRDGASTDEALVALDRARGLLAQLPDAERDALALTVLAGLSGQQAAAALGCSPSALTTRVHRARKRLEQLLAEEASQEVVRDG